LAPDGTAVNHDAGVDQCDEFIFLLGCFISFLSLQEHSLEYDTLVITEWLHLQHTHTHPFNGPFRTTRVSWYQKGKTNLDFTEARDSEWQWHQLGHMEVCTSLQTDNYASTPPLSFLQAGCPSCHPTNSVKALKVYLQIH